MINVLFVCLGNICRSPMAEAVFQKMVDEAGLSDRIQVDSAGTGAWHIGEPAHRGTRRILAKHGIRYRGKARQVTTADLDHPNSYILAMDDNNLAHLARAFGGHPKLYRLLDFAQDSNETNIPDPYYNNNFDYVFELVGDGCRGLLAMIRAEQGL